MTRSVLATLVCVSSAACSSGPGAPAAEVCGDGIFADGEFDLTVSGPGAAVMCGISEVASDGSGMRFLSTTDISNATFFSAFPAQPSPGTYAIVDFLASEGSLPSGVFSAWVIFDEAVLDTGVTSVSGTITIDTSSPSEFSGSFEFSARAEPDGEADYTVSGTFSATVIG